MLCRYIQQRIEENATYRSDITGQSFQTIKKMIQNVQNYSIKKYSAFVLESGLSRNKDHYIRTLNYKNDMLNINYQKFMIDYNVRKQQVQDYDSAMIGTVMVPSINEKQEYYMSRTIRVPTTLQKRLITVFRKVMRLTVTLSTTTI